MISYSKQGIVPVGHDSYLTPCMGSNFFYLLSRERYDRQKTV